MSDDPEARDLELIVRHKEEAASGVFLFELCARDGAELPPFTPGSHITLTAPSGQKRRYSLCNDSNDQGRYLIAVKRDPSGRGGSLSVTTDLNVGDQVTVSPPVNEFAMSKNEPKRYVFIAGGIGITPIRAMILHCLRHGRTNFTLYYFTRTPDEAAFRKEFAGREFAGKVVIHHTYGKVEQRYDLWPVLEEQNGAHLYCCGPSGLMDEVRDMTGHWSDASLHFEDFVGSAAVKPDDTAFDVVLRRSGETFGVAAGTSILDALRKQGKSLASSCESGTCGTCRTRYMDGEVDHRDLVLSEREKRTDLMICVSRARSPFLILDL